MNKIRPLSSEEIVAIEADREKTFEERCNAFIDEINAGINENLLNGACRIPLCNDSRVVRAVAAAIFDASPYYFVRVHWKERYMSVHWGTKYAPADDENEEYDDKDDEDEDDE